LAVGLDSGKWLASLFLARLGSVPPGWRPRERETMETSEREKSLRPSDTTRLPSAEEHLEGIRAGAGKTGYSDYEPALSASDSARILALGVIL
jgi:hypothetical protein